jgi:hypothetical protein
MKQKLLITTEPIDFISRPKGYWIPASCDVVIERLKMHGILMETLEEARANCKKCTVEDGK